MTTATEMREWVLGVAKQLTEGEKVEVDASDKTRTLTVTEEAHYVERSPYRCDGYLVDFEGYGTEYTLEIPDQEESPPVLLYPSGNALGELVRDIQRKDEESIEIVAEQTAADLGIPEQ